MVSPCKIPMLYSTNNMVLFSRVPLTLTLTIAFFVVLLSWFWRSSKRVMCDPTTRVYVARERRLDTGHNSNAYTSHASVRLDSSPFQLSYRWVFPLFSLADRRPYLYVCIELHIAAQSSLVILLIVIYATIVTLALVATIVATIVAFIFPRRGINVCIYGIAHKSAIQSCSAVFLCSLH